MGRYTKWVSLASNMETEAYHSAQEPCLKKPGKKPRVQLMEWFQKGQPCWEGWEGRTEKGN